jgi:TP901 family phage tail tape measure protein
MATVGEILLQLSGDAKPFAGSLQQGVDALTKFSKAAIEAGKEIEKFNAQTIQNIAKSNSELGKLAREAVNSIQPLTKELAKQNTEIAKNQTALNQMAIKEMGSVVGKENEATQSLKQMTDGLKGLSSSLWLVQTGLLQFGRAMVTNFTIPIVAAAGLSIKTFTDWEKGTIAIQRAAEITSQESNKIVQNFIDISTQVPLTVDDLIKAGYAAAQAGVTGEQAITNFSRAAVELSQVGGDALKGLPIEDLAEKLAKLSIAFGETGDNWGKVNNIASTLLVVAKAVPGGLGEITDGMRRAAGTAATFGLSLADTTALVGTLVASGVQANRAGTELSTIFLDMSKNADKVAQSLGYADSGVKEISDRMQNDMMGVLIELVNRYGAIGGRIAEVDKIEEIFGKTSMRALLPLLQNTELLIDLQKRANQEFENGTLLSADFATQANSLSGTMTVFGNSVKAVGYAVGKDLAPYVNYFLKTAVTGLTNLAKGWAALNPIVKAAIFLFASLAALIGPLVLLLTTLFVSPLSGLVTFITMSGKALVALRTTAQISTIAATGMTVFGQASTFAGLAMGSLLGGIKTLLIGLAALSIQFIVVLGVIAAVAGAMYLLGKVFGVKLKLPSMPEVNMPTAPTAPTGKKPKTQEEEAEDKQQEESRKKKLELAEKEEKALEKELRDKKKMDDKELLSKQNAVDKYEKVMDKEVESAQKSVDKQQEILDQKKEAWEDEKRAANEQIDAQEDIVKAAKKILTAQKATLSTLEKEKDSAVDKAKGEVELAKMSLDAAQEALDTEKKLGNDEYDASYRAAKLRVKNAQVAYELAQEEQIKVTKAYDVQIKAQEAIVDEAQQQVDVSESNLDDLKNALERRTAVVDKEVDLIEDELKTRQDALDKVKDSDQKKLDLLKDEKDELQKKYNEEESILQDKLDAEKDLVQSLKDAGVSELPEVTQDAVDAYNKLYGEFSKQVEDLQKQMKESLTPGAEVESGGLWDRMGKAYEDAKTKAKDAGVGTIIAFFTGVKAAQDEMGDTFDKFIVDTIFGQGTWDRHNEEAKSKGRDLTNAFQTALIERFKEWGSVIYSTGTSLIENLANGMKSRFEFLSGVVGKALEYIKTGWKYIWQEGYGWGADLINGLWQGVKNVWDSLKGNFDNIWNKIKDGIKNALGIHSPSTVFAGFGKDIMLGLKSGINDFSSVALDSLNDVAKKISDTDLSANMDISPIVSNASTNISDQATQISSIKGNSLENVPTTTNSSTVNKNYYIQPSQMIATRGEVRNFVRMIKEYDKFEEGR